MTEKNLNLVPAVPLVHSLKVPVHVEPGISILCERSMPGQHKDNLPSVTPALDMPTSTTSSDTVGPTIKRPRIANETDSGSEADDPFSGEEEDPIFSVEEDEEWLPMGTTYLLQAARRLRGQLVIDEERLIEAGSQEVEKLDQARVPITHVVQGDNSGEGCVHPEINSAEVDPEISETFSWFEDFSTFTGQEEVYRKTPGPQVQLGNKPHDYFIHIWDLDIIQRIVEETNKYAWQTICRLTELGKINKTLESWVDTTVEEMYRLLAVLNYMSLCTRARVEEYWSTGALGMPDFRKIMSRNRFTLLMRFLHFTDNDELLARAYERKIDKISPVLDHCNRKFGSMYTPQRALNIDECLLLSKGLSSEQHQSQMHSSIKSLELCECETGYMLRSLLYVTKNEADICMTLNSSSKFLDGYLDIGHLIVMDNWYNQLSLTRTLKRKSTDVIGTINRRRAHVPSAIRDAGETLLHGQQIALHCGDLSMIAWKEAKLVTITSSYHNAEQIKTRRMDGNVTKPSIVHTFNKYKGGVNLKERKLNTFAFDRKGVKWYMRIFNRLLNTSLLNCYIVYTKNPLTPLPTNRHFRYMVSEGLLTTYKPPEVGRIVVNNAADLVRLDGKGDHFPVHTEETVGRKDKYARRRCMSCTAQGKRTQITTMCSKCDVPLCIGKCWIEYHTFLYL